MHLLWKDLPFEKKRKKKEVKESSHRLSFVRPSRPQVDSICLTGQVVLNISQFSHRTVELLRTT